MKIIYSHLQKFLPKLSEVDPKQIANKLSWLGHFCNDLTITKDDTVIDLEVRQNRADCLGYYGIASDLAPLYGPLVIPTYTISKNNNLPPTPVTINSTDVYRIQSLTISNLKNTPSPTWLIDFLANHDINSINCLVDLTNYIMLLYGIPCHCFDADKVNHQLTWQNNQSFKSFTTLDGTKLNLDKHNLLITSQNQVVSLSFIGGLNSGVKLNTASTIIEMAVYNRSRVRSDSRSLKTITEASTRLDKFLDCNLIPQAFAHLSQLILDLLGGQITTKLLDYYPIPQNSPIVKLDLKQISKTAGVNIDNDFSQKVLKDLGCQVTKKDNYFQITPPSIRKDITIEEDLVEEVIRYFGYDNIPTSQPISSHELPDITPKIIYLIKSLKDQLVNLGYDEVKSWPLIQPKHFLENLLAPDQKAIYTQNNINSNYPILRPSLISSLINQQEQYHKYKLDDVCFFEIGKIFYQVGKDYLEKYSLGIFNPNPDQIKNDITDLSLSKPDQILTRPEGQYVEFILDDLDMSLVKTPKYNKSNSLSAVELTHQIVTLDANLTTKTKQDPQALIKDYSRKLGKHLWQIDITDVYHNPKDNTYKYTFRISYYNLTSSSAKKLHLDVFKLN